MKWKIRKKNVNNDNPTIEYVKNDNPIIGYKGSSVGDRKLVKKFAWLPIKHEEHKYWLESYEEVWEWKSWDSWEKKLPDTIGFYSDTLLKKFGTYKKFTRTGWKLVEINFRKQNESI
jgi:hypothetical protein